MDLLNTDEFTTDFHQRIDLSGYVLFIENSNQVEVVKYITSNYSAIQEAFKLEGKQFLLFSEIVNTSSILKPLKYHYPRLTKSVASEGLTFDTIKNYLGYQGNITTGLLSIETCFTSRFIEFESNSTTDFKKLTEGYLKDYKERLLSLVFMDDDYDDMISSGDFDSDSNINIDEDTKEIVNSILEQLQTLKDKGSLLQVLPIVENYLKNQSTVSISELSRLKIDENFSILLTDYNLEIKLSHLTKSIYLLFLNHPEGILLTNLGLYKKELLEHYKKLSSRDDFDKMQISIDDIVTQKSNAIYVHLSRIKSAFTKVVHHSIAKHYFIDGGKNKPKKIKLDTNLIQWNNTVEKTIVIHPNKKVSNSRNNNSNVDIFMGMDDEDSFFDD